MNLFGKIPIAIVLLLILTRPRGAGVGQWSDLGPYGADVGPLAVDPANSSHLGGPHERLFWQVVAADPPILY